MAVKPDKTKAEPGSFHAAACGCEMWTQDEVFILQPCSLDCAVYRYYQRAAAGLGRPVEHRLQE